MADLFLGEPSNVGVSGGEISTMAPAKSEKPDHSITEWYFNREEIENSPSRKDGIDLRKETYLRRSYSAFIQDLGMRLKVSQITIATAITFCHRFFHRQSHAKNDRHLIATVCMFLAAKVQETPRHIRDVILVSWEILSKKNPIYLQSINQMDFYEQQKQLVFFGEVMVLTNLGFDINVSHPYLPVLRAIKKFKVAQSALVQVAWNFVNDGLRTSLCLQFKPHQIAAGAIFLAAKFLKVKLPSDAQVAWWQEFKVTPQQLEEISNQILELYEQTYNATDSHVNEPGGSSAVSSSQMAGKSQSNSEATPSRNAYSQFCNIYSPTEANCGFEVPQAKETGQRRKTVVGEDDKNSLKCAYSSSYGKDASTLETCPSVDSRCMGKTVSSVNHDKPNTKKYPNGNRFIRLKVNEGDTRTLEEREGYKLHNDRQENQTRGMIEFISMQDTGLPVNSKCMGSMGKPAVSANQLGHNNKKISDQKIFRQSEANEVEERTLEERQGNIRGDSGPGNETGGRIKSNDSDQFSSIRISDINKDKVREALERRRASRRQERDSRSEILESEIVDEDALIEFELENGLEVAVKAEKAKEKRKEIHSISCYRSEQGSLKTRQEHVDGGGHGLKIKRSNEGKGKIRECSSDKADLPDRRQEMFPADCLDDEREEGELPISPLQDLVHSPRPSGSWSQASSRPDNGRSTINRHNYHSRDGSNGGRNEYRSRDSKIRECSSDKADLPHRRQEMFPADCIDDEMEEGELPNSPLQELVHSPISSGSWSQASSRPDNGRSIINRHNYRSRDGSNGGRNKFKSTDNSDGGRIRHRSTDGSDDRRRCYSHRHRHHFYNHQHILNAERYCHRSNDRDDDDWQEPSYKKRRHDPRR